MLGKQNKNSKNAERDPRPFFARNRHRRTKSTRGKDRTEKPQILTLKLHKHEKLFIEIYFLWEFLFFESE